MRINKNIELAKNWLLNSGIQNLDSNLLEVKGGFNSWYDIDNKNYFYTYAEITGYAITKLLYLYSLEKDNLYLLRATLAAEWLLDKASHKSGGIKTRYFFNKENAQELYDFSSGVIHSFDNGIALNGLLDLYNVTKEERYLSAGKMIGNMLIQTMQKPDGSLYASYSHKEEAFKDSDEKWSTQTGSFHAKISMGLLKLYEATKENRYKQAAIKLCDYALDLQEKDGRFISFIKEKDTHMHPHCYSAEGLLFVGLHLNNKNYLNSAANAIKWVLDHQMDDGGIPSMHVNGKPVNHERSDVLAQTLRLGIITLSLELLDKKYEEKLDKLASRLLSFQNTSDDIKSNGGFFYGYDVDYRNNLKAEKKNHVNSWCTMFALQALIFYTQYKEGNFKFDKNMLV